MRVSKNIRHPSEGFPGTTYFGPCAGCTGVGTISKIVGVPPTPTKDTAGAQRAKGLCLGAGAQGLLRTQPGPRVEALGLVGAGSPGQAPGFWAQARALGPGP